MKSLLNHKESKATKKSKRTGQPVTFWTFGSDFNGDVGSRRGWMTVYPDGEVWEHYPHHYDGSTHYMDYSRQI